MAVGLIGIGNVLLGDERIGVHAVLTVRERYETPPGLEIIDGGTLGLDLLTYFEDFEKVIFVDAVNFGEEPGFIGVLEDDEIPARLHQKLSVHNIGLADLLSVSKLRGTMPKKVCLIGMQPGSMEFTFDLELSDAANAKIEELIQRVVDKLKEWNIECVLRSPQELSR